MRDIDKLRPYDLKVASVGDWVITSSTVRSGLVQGRVVDVSEMEVVIQWGYDHLSIFKNGDYPHYLKQPPLTWLGPDPVYSGDTLWIADKKHPAFGVPYKVSKLIEYRLECSSPSEAVIFVNGTSEYEIVAPTHWSLTKPEPEPRFIEINGHKVPEPMSEVPEKGARYYVFDLRWEGMVDQFWWAGNAVDSRWFERGLIHATREAAYAHAKALLSFTEVNHK